ncbi:MAG: hypothetical protein K6T85_19420, partial [Gorillibacterium sp.]|nr:hypothetical protein [Gorillibacterium sp.]
MTKSKLSIITLLAFFMVMSSGIALATPQVAPLADKGSLTRQANSMSSTLMRHEIMRAKGVITMLRNQDGHKSIQLQGIDTGGLVLNIAEDTIIKKTDGSVLNFSTLTLGQQIEAEHSSV